MNRILTLFTLLCVSALPARSEDRDTPELVRGIQYGIAWNVYWNAHLNIWDSADSGYYEATRAMRLLHGKEIGVTVRKRNSSATAADTRYYVSLNSPATNLNLYVQLVVNFQNGHIACIDSSVPPEDLSTVETNLILKIPEDITQLARVPAKPEELALIKKGLKTLVVAKNLRGTQHFYIAPFNELSPDVIIYWVEQKLFIKTGYPSNEDELIRTQFKQARFIHLDSRADDMALEDKQFLFKERERAFWINRWIANCVNDGALLEVE
jgi:hypothetical protein